MHGKENEQRQEQQEGQRVLTPSQAHTLHELARKVNGTYHQLMQLMRDLDIPFRK